MILTHGVNSVSSFPNEVLIGGRSYPYVQIGNQLWLAENLDYKWTGLPIGRDISGSDPRANYYNNNESTYGVNGNKYGLLYNWIAAKYLNDNKSTLLPSGWHIPSESEWNTLITEIGGSTNAGTKLKSTSGWSSGNGEDSYNFAAFPAGGNELPFTGLGYKTSFWSMTVTSDTYAKDCRLTTGASSSITNSPKGYCYSLRLVKDAT